MGCFNIFAAASQSRDEQLKRMTEAPIGPLIISLAIPTILSMLTTALYNTADTYFVSQLGTSASGAVGVVFCLMAIFQATGFTLGMGAGSVISRRLVVRPSVYWETMLSFRKRLRLRILL